MDTEEEKVLIGKMPLLNNLQKVPKMRSVDYLWMSLLLQTKSENVLLYTSIKSHTFSLHLRYLN